MGTIVGVVFPVKPEKGKKKTGTVITVTGDGEDKVEKTREDREFEEKEK